MSIFEYNEEAVLRLIRQDERQMGFEDGLEQGINENKKEVAFRMLKRGKMTPAEIAEDCGLTAEQITALEQEMQ